MDKLLHWVHEIRNRKVIHDKTLLETTKYRGFALWWILYIRLYYDLLKFFKTNKPYRRISTKILISARIKSLLYFFLYIPFVAFISRLFFPKTKSKKRRRKILYTSQFGIWRDLYDPRTKKTRRGNLMFDSIIRKLRKVNSDLQLYSTTSFGLRFFRYLKTAIEIRNRHSLGEFKPLEWYFSWDIFILSLIHI